MSVVQSYYIGIDGGGTSCRARIADAANNVLGEATAGSANIFQNHIVAWASVQQAIRLAGDAAGLTEADLQQAHIVAGLAGAEIPECAERFNTLVTGYSRFTLLSDAQIACLGAHDGHDGAIYIIGTGAIGLSLNNGYWQQVSGWGFPLDDIGSGAWLGQQALREAIGQRDGILPDGPLAQMVWSHFQDNASALVQWSQSASSGDYGAFAPMVLRAIEQHDAQAKAIVVKQIEHLTHCINTLVPNGEPLCLMGGLADWVEKNLPQSLQQRLSHPQGDALSGALGYAQKGGLV